MENIAQKRRKCAKNQFRGGASPAVLLIGVCNRWGKRGGGGRSGSPAVGTALREVRRCFRKSPCFLWVQRHFLWILPQNPKFSRQFFPIPRQFLRILRHNSSNLRHFLRFLCIFGKKKRDAGVVLWKNCLNLHRLPTPVPLRVVWMGGTLYIIGVF